MDIMLQRILSLIPKKEDGKFVHGAKKEFAEKLNMAHNLVTMWEKGQSTSYRSKVHEIADIYNVSVEWLKGESDIKEKSPAPEGAELNEARQKAWELIKSMDENTLRRFIAAAEAMLG